MLPEVGTVTGNTYDDDRTMACGLFYGLDVARAEELAETAGMPIEVILEHAEPCQDSR